MTRIGEFGRPSLSIGALALGLFLLPARLTAQEFRVGGFIAMELEVQRESGGHEIMAEINKARFNFGLQMTEDVSILAEYNPIPEELTHQVDELTLEDGTTLAIGAAHAGGDETEAAEGEKESIPFERLEVRWENLGRKNLNLSVGQLRSPFGFWEDFSAHRNTTSTKNNALVLGIALRNVDIGAQVDGVLRRRIRYVVGIRNGATIRTQEPRREDDNDRKDMVGKVVLDLTPVSIGMNAYFVDSRTEKYALGAEFILPLTSLLTLSGEGIVQVNRPDDLESLSSYIQANYNLFDLLEGLRAYALLDFWQLDHEGDVQGDTVRLSSGIKYKVIPQGVTLSAEYGVIRARPLSPEWPGVFTTQVEVSF